MAKRNILKINENVRGKIPDRYDLTIDDLYQLRTAVEVCGFDGIQAIFRIGFVLGARAQKAGNSKCDQEQAAGIRRLQLRKLNFSIFSCFSRFSVLFLQLSVLFPFVPKIVFYNFQYLFTIFSTIFVPSKLDF